MATIPTPHPSWCDPTECSTHPDGQIVHRSPGSVFELNTTQIWTASMLTVQLVEASEGVKVGLTVEGAAMRSSETLVPPDVAAELGEALLDHAQRAEAPAQDGMAALLDALEDVSITDDERHSLRWLCSYGGGDVARHVAALITRARRNSTADR